MPILLSEDDVRAVLSMDDLVPRCTKRSRSSPRATCEQPLRTRARGRRAEGVLRRDAGRIEDPPALGTKLVTVFASNANAGLPTSPGDHRPARSTTGELLAVMDGRYITEARTAAVSAASVQLLARERRLHAGDPRLRRAGAKPLRRDRAASRPDRRSGLEPEREASCRRSRGRCRSRERRRSARWPRRARRSMAPISSCSRPRRASRWCEDDGLPTARMSARSAPAARISARWTRRSSARARVRGFAQRARWPRPATSCSRSRKARSMPTTSPASWANWRSAGSRDASTPADVTIFKSLGMAVEDLAAAHLAYVKAAERGLGRGFVL